MRARVQVLSAGRRRRSSRALRLSGNKSLAAAEEDPRVPVQLPQDMSLCYRLLRQLVPGLPPGRAASRVEILQHVIDYILDLQTELDSSCPPSDPGEPQPGDSTGVTGNSSSSSGHRASAAARSVAGLRPDPPGGFCFDCGPSSLQDAPSGTRPASEWKLQEGPSSGFYFERSSSKHM